MKQLLILMLAMSLMACRTESEVNAPSPVDKVLCDPTTGEAYLVTLGYKGYTYVRATEQGKALCRIFQGVPK